MSTNSKAIRSYKLEPGGTVALGVPRGAEALCVTNFREVDSEDDDDIYGEESLGISMLVDPEMPGSMRTFTAIAGNSKVVYVKLDSYVGSAIYRGKLYHVFETVLGG